MKKNVYVCQLQYEVMVMADEGNEYFGDCYTIRKAFLNDEASACKFLDADHSNEAYEHMIKRHNGKRVFVNHAPHGRCHVYEVDE